MNLSDLAAMGAAPLGYLLALARAKEISDAWLAEFCAGLAADNAAFGIALLGGDTVSTPGPLTLSLTAIGEVPEGHGAAAQRRQAGRRRLGLRARSAMPRSGLAGAAGRARGRRADARAYLIERYRLPRPRLALGQALRGIASAAIDVSDGLVADLGHILETSGVGAELRADALPLSAAARDLPGARDAALSGGDDYELLFTAPPEAARARSRRSRAGSTSRSPASARSAPSQVFTCWMRAGQELPILKAGWQHF